MCAISGSVPWYVHEMSVARGSTNAIQQDVYDVNVNKFLIYI